MTSGGKMAWLQSAIRCVTPLPSMTSGGKMAWRNGELFDMLLTAFAPLLTNVNCGQILYESKMHLYQ